MPQFLVKRGKIAREGKIFRVGEYVDLPQIVADRVQGGILESVKRVQGEPVRIEPDKVPEKKPEERRENEKVRRKG